MHVSLYVSNIAKTLEFYTTFFNQQPEKIKADYTKFILEHPSLVISFVENPTRVKSGFGHLGFQVETEQELAKRLLSLQTKNIEILEEIGTNCCYATQDKFWVTDPDGYQWEVYFFHQDSEFNDPKYSSNSKGESCCTPTHKKEKITLSELQSAGTCSPESGCC